jgi:hypothetical protein
MIIRDSSGTSPQNNMIVQPEQAKACDLFITRHLRVFMVMTLCGLFIAMILAYINCNETNADTLGEITRNVGKKQQKTTEEEEEKAK